MNLQSYLQRVFTHWQPPPPEVVDHSKYDVTLSWAKLGLDFLAGDLIYRVERKNKLPPWVLEYCGGRTSKRIDNLAPSCPHKFRLQVIVKAEAICTLADKAREYYGNEENALETLQNGLFRDVQGTVIESHIDQGSGDVQPTENNDKDYTIVSEEGDTAKGIDKVKNKSDNKCEPKKKWLESKWSELLCTNTDSVGSSAVGFCMAVQGGYLKHVQSMLDERSELVGIINNTSGYTPLSTAVRSGDLNMVKLLLTAGAEVDQLSTCGQTPLHIAVLSASTDIVDLLLETGADFQELKIEMTVQPGINTGKDETFARDKNDMRVEHYAVDSGDLEMLRHVLDIGGDVTVQDSNHWTPLFRAVIQGTPTALIEELINRGSDIDAVDRAGLTIPAAARLLTNRHGKPRHSVMRLVDQQYPRETALANFTRLTKKISSVHSLLKPSSPTKPTN